MKNHYKFLLGALTAVFLLSSCGSLTNFSIEKRQHRGGYYVDWGNSKVKVNEAKSVDKVRATDATSSKSAKASLEPKKYLSVENTYTSAEDAEATATATQKNHRVKHNLFNLTSELVASSEIASSAIIAEKEVSYSLADSDDTQSSGSTPTWVLVILAIFIPPLAVYLAEGIGSPFWIDLVLALIGLGAFGVPLLGLAWLAAIIYAFVVIFG